MTPVIPSVSQVPNFQVKVHSVHIKPCPVYLKSCLGFLPATEEKGFGKLYVTNCIGKCHSVDSLCFKSSLMPSVGVVLMILRPPAAL